MLEYKTVDGYAKAEWEIHKSRFIAYVNHVENEAQAQEFINEIKKKHFDATHNCYAYIIGEHSDTQKSNDDGEPSGTAGVPILEVLKKNELSDIAVVVTRYFGGILLGTGGLVKAYQDSVKLALEDLPLTTRMIPAFVTACFDHRYVTVFLRLLPTFRAEIIDSSFADKAFYHVRLPQSEVENFRLKLIEMTKGQVDFSEVKN